MRHIIPLIACGLCGCSSSGDQTDASTPDANANDVSIDVTTPTESGVDGSVPVAPLLTESGPINLVDAGTTILKGLHITSDAGPCVQIVNSTGITIEASEIGPCAGNGIEITNGNGIKISDSYVHPEHPATGCCDTGDGVFVNGTQGVTLAGNVIAFGEANIEVTKASHVKVTGNFLLNPQNAGSRGQNFQSWNNVTDVTIQGNYALSSTDAQYKYPEKQEDSINFGFTDQVVVDGNYVQGGHSASGCGIIADEAANSVTFSNNVLVDTGQCGVSISSGTNQMVVANKIINSTPVAGGGNTGLVVWKQYTDACGPVNVANNISSELKPDLTTESGYWNGGGCDPTTLTNNTWDSAARALLTPVAQKLPPPLIPPKPVTCVPATPWTNQTSAPACWSPTSAQ